MNPRHRRLVIPVALAVLLLIVVVAAVWPVNRSTTPWSGSRSLLLDPDGLVRAVGSGRRKGRAAPRGGGSSCATSTSRPVATCRSRRTTTRRPTPPTTPVGEPAAAAVDELLDRALRQLARRHHDRDRTSCGSPRRARVLVHAAPRERAVAVDRDHDRDKQRLLPEDDPVLVALGITDREGRVKPSRQAKYRQVEEFLRILDAAVARRPGAGPPPHAHARRTRCGSSTSAAATPTSPSPPTGSSARCGGCRSG